MILPRHYVESATFEAERTLFEHSWLLFDALAAIPRGSARAARIHHLPIVVWHTDDGVRAFLNVCRHRAAPLVDDGACTPATRLRCRYHGWQYDHDGRLARTPDFGADVPDLALTPLAVKVWRGLVFVRLHGEAAFFDLDDIPDLLGDPVHVTHELACNWKTYIENYLEGYHIPYLHPGLSAEIDLRTYRVEASGGVARHVVDARPGAANAGYWAWLWPNAALNLYDRALCLERVLPTGPQTCRIAYTYLFHPDLDEAERQQRIEQSAATTAEDIGICEAVQRNLASGHASLGPLSPRHEQGIAHFHALWHEAMAE